MALRIFLSYAREDRDRVSPFFDILSNDGYDPWIDFRKLLPGQNWEVEIEHALNSAHVVLAFLSKRSVTKRGFVQRELNQALDKLRYRLPTDVYLIPVLLEQCDVPVHLANRLHYVDLSVDGAWKQVLASLSVAAVQQDLATVDGTPFGPFRVTRKTLRSGSAGEVPVDIDIEFPEFDSTTFAAEATALSSFFAAQAKKSLELSLRAASPEDQGFASKWGAPGEAVYSYSEWFTLTHATQRMISLTMNMSDFLLGTAHGNHGTTTFNFSLVDGARPIQLSDLFTDAAAAEQKISRICLDQLCKFIWEVTGEDPDEGSINWIQTGCKPSSGKFDQFSLLTDGILITFPPYQVGPYALGTQSVDISYYDLRAFLKPRGPHRYAQPEAQAASL